jgi:hypothetical protein
MNIEQAFLPIYQKLDEISARILKLEASEGVKFPEQREISFEQAKAEITRLFKESKGELYYSDIAGRLRLDLKLVVEVCDELLEEGVITFE